MDKQFFKLAMILVVLSLPLQSYGWNSIGHMLIIQMAYKNLDSKAKDEIQRAVKEMEKMNPRLHGMYGLVIWPDVMIREGDDRYKKWHYLNWPYVTPGIHWTYAMDKNNVISGIQESRIRFQKASSPKERAFWLSMLIHLIGDAHQPLHCINRYSRRTPWGDGGGNLYPISSRVANNLHAYWDRGLGLFQKRIKIRKRAKWIQRYYSIRKLKRLNMPINANKWCENSRNIAKNVVYKMPWDGKPSRQYRERGQQIVYQQLAKASYILAVILNHDVSETN